MTPNETIVLTYLIARGIASDSMIQNQCHVTSGALATIARSLKTKLLVQQDGRFYRATQAGQLALMERSARQPFAGQEAW